jgi:pimeloyl-ACP methyl ester carboxylesterase
MMVTEEYAPGREVDVHGEGHEGIVLLWHGKEPNSRRLLSGLAASVAATGARVLNADWDSAADDRGRADLLGSVRHARETADALGLDPADLVVVGWSLGGVAATSLAVHAKRLGIAVGHTVLIAPADGPRAVDPISGAPLPHPMPPGAGQGPVDVLHGSADDITKPAMVRGLEERLRSAGWATTLTELETDHWDIVDDPAVTAAVVAAVRTTSSS